MRVIGLAIAVASLMTTASAGAQPAEQTIDGAQRFPVEEVRQALSLPDRIPVIGVDARDRNSAKDALIAVSEYALDALTAAG